MGVHSCPRLMPVLLVILLTIHISSIRADLDVPPGYQRRDNVCADLHPRYGLVSPPENTSNQFVILLNQTQYAPNDVIEVRVVADGNETIRGIFLAARAMEDGREGLVGEFLRVPQELSGHSWFPQQVNNKPSNETYNCVIHGGWESGDWLNGTKELTLLWSPAGASVGDVLILATVIGEDEKWWYEGALKTVSAKQKAAAEPLMVPPKSLNKPDHGGCRVSDGCFLYPTKCELEECTYIVQHHTDDEDGNITHISITARDAEDYVTLAFSQDRYLGDSHTYICIHTEEGVRFQQGHNEQINDDNGRKLYVENDLRIPSGVSNVSIGREGDEIYCRFSLHLTSALDEWMDDPAEEDHPYLMIYTGEVFPRSFVVQTPQKLPVTSRERVDLRDPYTTSGRSLPPLYIAHSALHLLSILWFGAYCLIIPRFFKGRLGGEWSKWHRFHSFMYIALSLAGIICIAVELRGVFTQTASLHGILGIILMIFTLMMALMGGMTLMLDEEDRGCIGGVHLVMGYFDVILGVAVILLGYNVPILQDNLIYRGSITVILWVVFIAIIWILYESLRVFVWPKASVEKESQLPIGVPGGAAFRFGFALLLLLFVGVCMFFAISLYFLLTV